MFERSEQDRNKAETLNSIVERAPSIDFQTRLEISFDRHRFRFPRIQITKAELRAVCAVRSRHFGPLCGIKNVPRIFSPPPLFFFSLFLDTRKFADRETRERVVVAKNRGLEEKLNRREGQIRLFDESFIYVVYIPVNQFNQNSLWQND